LFLLSLALTQKTFFGLALLKKQTGMKVTDDDPLHILLQYF
jgi:hypothetical protein